MATVLRLTPQSHLHNFARAMILTSLILSLNSSLSPTREMFERLQIWRTGVLQIPALLTSSA